MDLLPSMHPLLSSPPDPSSVTWLKLSLPRTPSRPRKAFPTLLLAYVLPTLSRTPTLNFAFAFTFTFPRHKPPYVPRYLSPHGRYSFVNVPWSVSSRRSTFHAHVPTSLARSLARLRTTSEHRRQRHTHAHARKPGRKRPTCGARKGPRYMLCALCSWSKGLQRALLYTGRGRGKTAQCDGCMCDDGKVQEKRACLKGVCTMYTDMVGKRKKGKLPGYMYPGHDFFCIDARRRMIFFSFLSNG